MKIPIYTCVEKEIEFPGFSGECTGNSALYCKYPEVGNFTFVPVSPTFTQLLGVYSYESSYSRDYCPKGVLVRVPRRTGSASRKHNPQPRNVFLLRRMFNEVCTCM